jgi:hypothetical protein
MELKDYIKSEFDGLKRNSGRVLNTLTQQEMSWRPAAGCNSMGLILFHVIRSEDSMVQGTLAGKTQVWENEKWYQKLNLAQNEAGSHYSCDQVNAFAVPDIKMLMSYYDAVRVKTLEYLQGISPAEFERKVKLPFGEFSVAGMFSLVVSHSAGHIGEISYLRGLLRGMDK